MYKIRWQKKQLFFRQFSNFVTFSHKCNKNENENKTEAHAHAHAHVLRISL